MAVVVARVVRACCGVFPASGKSAVWPVVFAIFAAVFPMCGAAHVQDAGYGSKFGSRAVMDAIWTDAQLRGTEEESKVSSYHQPDLALPDGGCTPLRAQGESNGVWGNIRSVSLRPDVGKVVALTFDFCELSTKTAGYDGGVIDFLRQRGIPATLFLGGKWMKTHPERAMQLIADPLFEIGNHAWTHGNFALLPVRDATEQVMCTERQYEILRSAVGARLHDGVSHEEFEKIPNGLSLFRLPYGRVADANLDLLRKSGVRIVQWDVVVPEWERISDKFVSEMGIRRGSILLMHATSVPPHTLENLKVIVGFLQKEGYSFATVTELLDMGSPNVHTEGYFRHPGDNVFLDNRYLNYGTAHPPPNGHKPAGSG
ncbi:polysaccharide deacetylase family protein [Anaplasma marginale]|uniref:Chitooligosaccharide deacetylase n=1 Tax=Anaplasma marginale TaxID=770 RepID=A0A643CNY9_ANAMA|nr:polysaccharide deacetylase family protein [Anaplasma marginale]KAB0452002.1 polysaccharide deacetylase family protein [Anaplasma marginale]